MFRWSTLGRCTRILSFTIAVAAAGAAVARDESGATGETWTRFRGPNGTGVSQAATVPATWTDADYNWKATLPGEGHSSPVIAAGKVFLTSAAEDGARRFVLAVSTADGGIGWHREFPSSTHKKHQLNSFASPTPAVDDQRVYCTWSAPEAYTVTALTHDGQPAWQRDLGPYESQHSAGPSPVLYGDLLLVGNDQDSESSLLALDRRTGETRWQTPRQHEFVSYATPCVYRGPSGQDELIFLSGAHGVSSIDPQTGQTNWELDVFDKRTVSSPILAEDLIVGTCGSGGGGNYVAAVRPGRVGRAAELAYKIDKSAPYCPTGVIHGGRMYLWSEQGVATCVNVADGAVIWQKRVGGKFFGSPILVADKLYCISADGEVVVLAAADEYELLGRMSLGELSHSTPAVADGVMYLRTISHLYSVGGAK